MDVMHGCGGGREMKDWSDGGMYFEEVRDI